MDRIQGPSRPEFDPARIRRLFRRTWRLIRIPLLVWLGLLALFASLQARLIFPGAQTQGQPYASVRPPVGAELVTLSTVNGDRVVALFGPALTPAGHHHPEASRRPTLLYFYGNGMCLNDTSEQFDHFRRLGANVLIPEYVGYGMSGGQPSETGCRATADAAYDHLHSRRDVDPRAIVAVGWSLGGAVAIDLASRRPVAGLAAFSTFTSLVEMARRNFPFPQRAPLATPVRQRGKYRSSLLPDPPDARRGRPPHPVGHDGPPGRLGTHSVDEGDDRRCRPQRLLPHRRRPGR